MEQSVINEYLNLKNLTRIVRNRQRKNSDLEIGRHLGIFRMDDFILYVQPGSIFKVPIENVRNFRNIKFKKNKPKVILDLVDAINYQHIEYLDFNKKDSYLIEWESDQYFNTYYEKISEEENHIRLLNCEISKFKNCILPNYNEEEPFTMLIKRAGYSLIEKKDINKSYISDNAKEKNFHEIEYYSLSAEGLKLINSFKGEVDLLWYNYGVGKEENNYSSNYFYSCKEGFYKKEYEGHLSEKEAYSVLERIIMPTQSNTFKLIFNSEENTNFEIIFKAPHIEIE